MKEKIKNGFEKVSDFLDDHGEQLVEAAMFSFYAVLTIGVGNYWHLSNRKTRQEIKALRQK